MKNILIALGLLIVAVLLAGIYKFNFTNDDMYVEMPNGEVMPIDEAETMAETATLMTISKEEFAAKYLAMKDDGAQLIDVRTQQEYDDGYYEGAQLIDFYASDFREQLDVLDKDVQYFIHCRSGNRSGQALTIMRELGFTKVYDLAGGFANAQDILPVIVVN